MTDTDDLRWTRRPIAANKARPRWPTHAEEWDADYRTELQGGWKRRKNDPRPNIGIGCGGHFCSHSGDHTDTRIRHRFECTQCGLGKVLAIDRRDRYQQIKFACPACREQTIHNPAGVTPRLLTPFDHDTNTSTDSDP